MLLTEADLFDIHCLKRYLGGDTASLGELYQRYNPRLEAVLISLLHNSEDAKDVAQEVWVQIMGWKKLRPRGKFFTLLCRFGRYLVLHQVNRARSWRAVSVDFQATGGQPFSDSKYCRYCKVPLKKGSLCDAHFKRRSRGASEAEMLKPVKTRHRSTHH